MKDFMQAFFAMYGMPLLYAIITAAAGAAATFIGRAYNKWVNSREKRAVAKTVVMATEQIYKDLHGKDKYNKAIQALAEMLALKGISITELEARMLIEAAVGEFNRVFEDTVEPLPDVSDVVD